MRAVKNSTLKKLNKCMAISCAFIFLFIKSHVLAQTTNQVNVQYKLDGRKTKNKSELVFCNCEKYQKRAEKEFAHLKKAELESNRKRIKLKMRAHKLKVVREKRRKSFDSKSVRCFNW